MTIKINGGEGLLLTGESSSVNVGGTREIDHHHVHDTAVVTAVATYTDGCSSPGGELLHKGGICKISKDLPQIVSNYKEKIVSLQ